VNEQVKPTENALSVSMLASLLSKTLQHRFPGTVTVDAEITNFKSYPSGHWYFSLTDNQSTLSAVMFKGNNRMVRLTAKDGLQVRVQCEINFYAPNGKLQLIVKKMAESSEGDQKAKLDALKAKLIAEGLTALSRKRSLPLMPMHVGIITSSRGAVIRDMITVLSRRWPLAAIHLYSAAVQGEQAPNELIKAINRAIKEQLCDVIIIGRGGGSAEDLSAFNDEILCRAIAASPIPIVSAVGHETDTGLTDLVADVRAATPSQAAELISPDILEIQKRLATLEGRLRSRTEIQLSLGEQRLELITHKLDQSIQANAQRQRDRLTRLTGRLVAPTEYIALKRGVLTHLQQKVEASIDRRLDQIKSNFQQLTVQLDVLSPLATLSRGYGILLKCDGSKDRTIGSVDDLDIDTSIEIRLKDGCIKASVNQIGKE